MTTARANNDKLPRRDAVIKRAEQLLAHPSINNVDFALEYAALLKSYRKLHHKLDKTLLISDSYQQESKELAGKLEETLQNFQKLKEVALPICMVCHKIHTPNDYWVRLEDYFAKHADILFSHGICPECVKVTYGKLGEKILARERIAASAATGKRSSSGSLKQQQEEDSTLREMLILCELAACSNNPLTREIEKITRSYAKFLKRFNKILTLGDSYQSLLREFNLRLELMAHNDPLTGINNRGYFLELLNREMERAKRCDHPFSLLMIDLDHLQTINDTYGHGAGDNALRTLTSILANLGLRLSGYIGRVGGDEFAVILPDTCIARAPETAERILGNIAETVVLHDKNEFYISVSIGVSEFRIDDTGEALLNRVGLAVQRAKDTGMNRYCTEP